VREQLILRSLGHCEGARIRRDGEIIIEHAPDCSGVADWDHGHAAHNKSRGAGGKFELDNLRWVTAACHRWEHSGGKVIPSKRAEAKRPAPEPTVLPWMDDIDTWVAHRVDDDVVAFKVTPKQIGNWIREYVKAHAPAPVDKRRETILDVLVGYNCILAAQERDGYKQVTDAIIAALDAAEGKKETKC
jgi:hypothetical protein